MARPLISHRGGALLVAVIASGLAALAVATSLMLASSGLKTALSWRAAVHADLAASTGLAALAGIWSERFDPAAPVPDSGMVPGVRVQVERLAGDLVLVAVEGGVPSATDGVRPRRGELRLFTLATDSAGQARLWPARVEALRPDRFHRPF